ncbi:MAG TPA: WD40 repeat domain-containing protein [Tepidisphaeraceae bacterium]
MKANAWLLTLCAEMRSIFIILFAATVTHAAEPATRPSAVVDLPNIDARPQMRLGTLAAHATLAVQASGGGLAAGTGVAAIGAIRLTAVDLAKNQVSRAIDLPGVTVRGLATVGSNTLVWGDRPGVPTDRRLSSVPYLAVWDAAAGVEKVRFDDKDDYVARAAALSVDGLRVLTAQDERPLRLWDAISGLQLRSLETGRNVSCVALSADSRRAVLGGGWGDEGVYVWDLQTNRELLRCVGHHGVVTSVALSTDERFILSASLDGSTRLWDARTGQELRRLRPLGLSVYRAVFSPDGMRALTTLAERPAYGQPHAPIKPGTDLRLWDLVQGKVLLQYETGGAPVLDSAFTADGRDVVALTATQTFQWVAPAVVTPTTGPTTSPATSPATMQAATIPADPLATPLLPPGPDGQVAELGDESVQLVGFLSNDRAYAVGERNRIAHWDLTRRFRRGQWQPAKELQGPDVVSVSADGRYAVSLQSSGDNEASVWELASGLVSAPVVTQGQVRSAALSPDGTLVALGVQSSAGPLPNVIEFYRTQDAAPVGTIDPAAYQMDSILFTPDGNRVLLSGTQAKTTAGEFDLDTGKLVANYVSTQSDVPEKFTYSADGSRLAGIGPRGVTVWETKSGTRLQHWTMQTPLTAVALSPDGRRVVTGGADTNVRVYDVATGRSVVRFDHPMYPVKSVAVSPDGRRVLCGAGDKALRVFELPATPVAPDEP